MTRGRSVRAAGAGAAAVIVATAMCGAAATLPMASPALGAASAAGTRCDDAVTLAPTMVYDITDERYEVTQVVVDGLRVPACTGATVQATLVGPGGTTITDAGPATVTGSSVSLPLGPDVVPSRITGHRILVEGP